MKVRTRLWETLVTDTTGRAVRREPHALLSPVLKVHVDVTSLTSGRTSSVRATESGGHGSVGCADSSKDFQT